MNERILIVDDEHAIRQLLTRYLEGAGYSCRAAENVQQAKDILLNEPIDLLLSDISMPEESGSDLVGYVRQNFPDLGVVIISALDNPRSAARILELGVYGYLVKPFSQNIVLINVDNALRRQRLELQSKHYQHELESKIREQTASMHNQLVLLQSIMDVTPSAIFYLDRDGTFLGCNKVFEKFVGQPRGAILGQKMFEVCSEALVSIYHASDRQNHRSEQQELKTIVRNAEGRLRHMLANKAVFLDENNNVKGIVGTLLDITERQEMNRALRFSEERYQQIVEHIDLGVAIINPQMELVRMNLQMKKWFPHVEPNPGIFCHQMFQNQPEGCLCDNCPAVRTFAEGKSFEATVQAKGAGGDRYFRAHSFPLHDEVGKVYSVVLVVEEVTEKLVFEQELRQSQKLEAIGQLAAGIAHEINTPIQYVGDNTRFLQDVFTDLIKSFSTFDALLQAVKSETVTEGAIGDVDRAIQETDLPYLKEEIPRAIEQSLEGVQRVTEIVSAMREFSHPGTDQKTPVDLNVAINNTITVARNEWKYVADMELDLDPTLPEVLCLPGEINQVILNIIVNAAHAIADALNQNKQEKGKISIASRTLNNSVAIHISDTGTGIPREVQHRIFDPFFTTKGVGQGTGQGLAIAHSVITDKHGGKLRFETQQGRGTTFIVELPLSVV